MLLDFFKFLLEVSIYENKFFVAIHGTYRCCCCCCCTRKMKERKNYRRLHAYGPYNQHWENIDEVSKQRICYFKHLMLLGLFDSIVVVVSILWEWWWCHRWLVLLFCFMLTERCTLLFFTAHHTLLIEWFETCCELNIYYVVNLMCDIVSHHFFSPCRILHCF